MSVPISAVPQEAKDYSEKVAPVQSREHSDIEGHVEYENGEDEALKFTGHRVEISEEESRRVCRKIDLHMLPWYAHSAYAATVHNLLILMLYTGCVAFICCNILTRRHFLMLHRWVLKRTQT